MAQEVLTDDWVQHIGDDKAPVVDAAECRERKLESGLAENCNR